MSDAEWPAPEPAAPREPERRPAPLPRVEDLPLAEQGYDREKVREAFDAFYRHAAQLDATLSTLEAVEVFQRTSAELRAELRTIRGSGWTVQSWQAGGGSYGTRGRVSEWSLPPAFPRVAGEALFLIVMGVIVGVAGWSRLTIVLVMALALGVVWLIEWVAARERAIPQAVAPVTVPDLDEEVPELPAGEAKEWGAAQEEGPEAMTMLGTPAVRESDEPVEEGEKEDEPADEPVEADSEDTEEEEAFVQAEAEPVEEPVEEPPPVEEPEPEPEPEPVAEADEPEPEPELLVLPEPQPGLEPEPRRRFGFFRRRRDDAEAPAVELEPLDQEPEEPELVAGPEPVDDEVLDGAVELVAEPETAEPELDPWEAPAAVPEEPVASAEPDEPEEPEAVDEVEPLEPEPEPAAEAEQLMEPEPEPEAEPEPEPEGPLPVEALAEQAAAALERSRARRRNLRRARRR